MVAPVTRAAERIQRPGSKREGRGSLRARRADNFQGIAMLFKFKISLSNTKIEFLQRLQDRAVSMIHTSRIKDSWIPKFLSVKQLITFDRVVMVYKILRSLISCAQKIHGTSSI